MNLIRTAEKNNFNLNLQIGTMFKEFVASILKRKTHFYHRKIFRLHMYLIYIIALFACIPLKDKSMLIYIAYNQNSIGTILISYNPPLSILFSLFDVERIIFKGDFSYKKFY